MTLAPAPVIRFPLGGLTLPNGEYHLRKAVERRLLAGPIECFICARSLLLAKDVHLDHDHETGQLRGLLCRDCNLGLGSFKDQPEMLRRAAFYLEADVPGSAGDSVWDGVR